MTQADLVSVVVPVHDVRPFLRTCVESLQAQTHRELEILLVDDGSTDGSGELCDDLAALDDRIRVIHQCNRGLSGARNAGLSWASGDHVAFLDADDWIEAGAIEAQLRIARQHDADVVVSGFHVDTAGADGSLRSTQMRVPDPVLVKGALPDGIRADEVVAFVGYAWNKLYRRSLLQQFGPPFPEGVSLVEDILANEPLLARAQHVVFSPMATVHYVQRPRETFWAPGSTRNWSAWSAVPGVVASAASSLGLPPQRKSVQSWIGRVRTGAVGTARVGGTRANARARRAAVRELLARPGVRAILATQTLGFGLFRSQRAGWALPPYLRTGYAAGGVDDRRRSRQGGDTRAPPDRVLPGPSGCDRQV